MDLEEALAQADTYSVDEGICTIDNDLRTITIPSGLQTVGVESDEDVRRLNFQMPKQYGEVDLSEFNIRINFMNANNQGDVYAVTDKQVTGDNITFSWLVGRNALAYRGSIRFIVCLKRADAEGVVQQEFNTTIAQLTVLEGLETTEAVVAENPDIIEQILARLDELEENGGGGGTPGKDGVGISNIAKTGTAGLVDTYTITMTDETSYTFTVKNGENGNPGQDGTTPTIGENGNWYLGETDTGKPSRGETPNIKIGTVQTLDPGNQATASMSGTPENPLLNLGIPKGEKGDPGEDAESGDSYTLPIMSDTQLGGGKAVSKTDEDVPVAVDPLTGQLFVPTYPENSGTVDPEQIKQAVNGYLEENPPSGMTAEQEQQLNKNTEDISSLSEDIENIKNEGVPIKDKTITPEKTTFILTEQQENIVTEVTRHNNHPAAVVENGISSGTTIYYNIAGINSLNIFDSGTGNWVSANISEYGTNRPYESNESGAKGKFTATKDIPKCLFYGSAVWTWKNPVINTTGVFFDGAKITGISNEFLDALKTKSDEIVKSGLENESGIITPEMTDFVNLDFLPIGKLDYSSPQMFYAVYLEKNKIYYCKSPVLQLYPNTNWAYNTSTPATPTGNGGFTIGNLETGTYYIKLDYIADADDRKTYADSYSDWVYSVPIGDNFVVNIGDYDLIPESDPVKRKIMEFTCDLVGKTWNALGDSNTQYPGGYQMWQSSNGQKGYVQYIGDKYYMSAKNNGTGGATWGTATSGNGCAIDKVDKIVSDAVKWDIVTFSFGTNADTSMGTYESTSADKTSLAGAMRYCIETMQANFPLTKLGVILPTRRSDGNLSNDVLKQRCELMTSIAHDYGVPVCDMFNESGTITSWYSDGLHICNSGSWSMDKPACYHYESKLEKFLLSL